MGCFPNSASGNIAVEPQLPRPLPQGQPQAPTAPQHSHPQGITTSLGGNNPQAESPKPKDPQAESSKPKGPQASSQPENPQVPPSFSNPQPVFVQPKKAKAPISYKHKDVQPTAKDKKLAEEIMGGFDVQKVMREKLNSVAHTPDQLEYIVNEVVKAVVELEEDQSPAEKKMVAELIGYQKEDKLFYHSFVKSFKSKKNTDLKQQTLSRIYHSIANLKKKEKVDKGQYNSEFGLRERTTNDYEKLSKAQVDEVVIYEAISEKVLELGTKLSFKFGSIEKDSNGIVHLLAETSSRHQKEIQVFKYDLSPQEFKKAAQISRSACSHHDNGVVLLFIYFVRSCRKLEQAKEPVASIEKKLDEAIQWVSKEYPPGQGLEAGKKHLEGVLRKLQHEDKFAHQPSKLSSSGDKQAQLEEIILQNAYTAKRSRDDFEELIREACFKHAIQTKVGLKLNPDSPNKKAMIRIKEKMLFGKAEKMEKKAKGTIQETIESEDKDYKEAIDRLLEEKEEVTFKISDMVRGKCVFLEVEDIILTVNQIKEFVRNDPKRRFRITEIESRFTNPQPISDVTLKIAINEEIVSELQLTIQANAAAYNFAHKVYELARTKVFSKVKISHNYFEEFAGDFKMQASKALQIAKRESQKKTENEKIGKEADLREKYSILVKQAATVGQLLDLQSMEAPKSYEEVLKRSIAEQREGLEGLTVSTNKKLQKLMVTLFRKQMGSWGRELGREIDQVLKSGEYPPLLKSTLLYHFFQSFDISKQITPMLHFYPSYKETLEKLQKSEQYIKEDYMEMYLQQVFGIERPFENIQSTARLFYRAQQTQLLTIEKRSSIRPSMLKVKELIKGVILEENSSENVGFISQLLLSFFTARGEKQSIVEQFDQYYRYLMKILDKKPKLVPHLATCPPKFLKAQQLLQGKKFSDAQEILEEIVVVFKENEEIEQELQCELLLAECKANTNDFKAFKEHYAKNVVKKAEALGIELRGVAVANSEFRIYQKVWDKGMSVEDQEHVKKTHLSKAMTESSKSEGEECLYKMVKVERKGQQVDKQCIRENRAVTYVNVSYNYEIFGKHMIHLESCRWPKLSAFYCIQRNLSERGCEYLSRADFKSLTILDIQDNKIDEKGCEHLSKANWPNLATLILNDNNVRDKGCQYLSKTNWPNLLTLNLKLCWIDHQGFGHLSKANWQNLQTLIVDRNSFHNPQSCKNLIKAKWKKLSKFSCCETTAGSEAFKFLSQADWFKNLSDLKMTDNRLGVQGSPYLIPLKKITKLNMRNNWIYDEGCKSLAETDWKNLTILHLQVIRVGPVGCEYLIKAKWPRLSFLDIGYNEIAAEGCETLSKADWKSLSKINLYSNKIKKEEMPFLRELWQENFPKTKVLGLQ